MRGSDMFGKGMSLKAEVTNSLEGNGANSTSQILYIIPSQPQIMNGGDWIKSFENHESLGLGGSNLYHYQYEDRPTGWYTWFDSECNKDYPEWHCGYWYGGLDGIAQADLDNNGWLEYEGENWYRKEGESSPRQGRTDIPVEPFQ